MKIFERVMLLLLSCACFYFLFVSIKDGQFVNQSSGGTFTKAEDPIFYYFVVFVALFCGIAALRKAFQSESHASPVFVCWFLLSIYVYQRRASCSQEWSNFYEGRRSIFLLHGGIWIFSYRYSCTKEGIPERIRGLLGLLDQLQSWQRCTVEQ